MFTIQWKRRQKELVNVTLGGMVALVALKCFISFKSTGRLVQEAAANFVTQNSAQSYIFAKKE